jgi:WhiB family redox-sensing transcriptional regulator
VSESPHRPLPCRQHPAELWFADDPSDVEQAKRLCRQCPLQLRCLAVAVQRHEPWGVWGGQLFENGRIVPRKRPRGRPRKTVVPA